MSDSGYPRDLVGHGRRPPHAQWPGHARVALQFVLNYEEGGECCVLARRPARRRPSSPRSPARRRSRTAT
ncbi:MAG: hypothetical protein U5K43_10435 [Halofilum sp. (in: g-proteobacteria)]|nr:hypothetical protein [Halofilum sp. (in: g-proteobacteria)]